jgi:hypothetical protein
MKLDSSLHAHVRGLRKLSKKHDKSKTGKFMLRVLKPGNISLRLDPACYYSTELDEIVEELSSKERQKFHHLFNKQFKKHNDHDFNTGITTSVKARRKFILTSHAAPNDPVAPYVGWRLKHIEDIKDEWVRRIIRFHAGIDADPVVDYVMTLKGSGQHEEILRYVGYSIFLGKSDCEVAKMWEITEKQVEAIRMILCDFSRLPKNTIAKLAHFRQLVQNEVCSDVDFQFFKLLDDLGDIALREISSSKLVTPAERLKIDEYLGSSMLENVIRIKMAVRTSKDSIVYNNVLNGLGNLRLKAAELQLSAAKVENLNTVTEKIRTDMGTQAKSGAVYADLLDQLKKSQDTLQVLSKNEPLQPEFRKITDLV